MLCFTCINDPYLAVLQGIHYISKSTAAAERRYIKKNSRENLILLNVNLLIVI